MKMESIEDTILTSYPPSAVSLGIMADPAAAEVQNGHILLPRRREDPLIVPALTDSRPSEEKASIFASVSGAEHSDEGTTGSSAQVLCSHKDSKIRSSQTTTAGCRVCTGALFQSGIWNQSSLGKGGNSCIVDVGDKARAVIEKLVTAWVIALKVLFPEWYAIWPLGVLQYLQLWTLVTIMRSVT